MDVRLYTMRFKQGMKGVISGFVEVHPGTPAEEQKEAEAKGRAYCDAEPGRRFIGVESAIFVRIDEGPQPAAKAAAEPKKPKAS